MAEDWRLNGQMSYLYRAKLRKAVFSASETNDHMHCEFCWDKFAEYDDCLHEGYCTLDGYYWVCEDCFRDFREMFEWMLVEPDAPVPQAECVVAEGGIVLVRPSADPHEKSHG